MRGRPAVAVLQRSPADSCSYSALQAWGGGGGGAVAPSPPISGREISALAVVRREPSWSARSMQRLDSGGGVPPVGYSVSPMQVTACWACFGRPKTALLSAGC